MINLSIQEPKIEQFFNHSKDEIINALRFIVDNNIEYITPNLNSTELTIEQKKELDSRISSFHTDRNIGTSWNKIKNNIKK
jgi:putative addiction module component (TIGR02574 family)